MRLKEQWLITLFKKIIRVARYPRKVAMLAVKLSLLQNKLRNTKKPAFLVLTHELSATGASILLLRIVEELARDGYEVVMVAPSCSAPSEHIRSLLPSHKNVFFWMLAVIYDSRFCVT